MKETIPSYETQLLGSALIAFVAAAVGNFFGGRNKVTEESCKERRCAINDLASERFSHLTDALDRVETKLDNLQ
jgi:hypothetical protein